MQHSVGLAFSVFIVVVDMSLFVFCYWPIAEHANSSDTPSFYLTCMYLGQSSLIVYHQKGFTLKIVDVVHILFLGV